MPRNHFVGIAGPVLTLIVFGLACQPVVSQSDGKKITVTSAERTSRLEMVVQVPLAVPMIEPSSL